MTQFLYEKLSLLEELDELTPLPSYISANLADHIELREYQEQGLKYFLTYMEHDKLRPSRYVQALFHMATGSGKTVMMAALILYLYKIGYRRFVFFVNQTTILEKTKANFLDRGSSKYLFAETVNIDGKTIPVREINNFAKVNEDAINIRFTSIQKLHYDLMYPSENGLSIEDFQDHKVALISDEAHHVNALTKKNLTKGEKEASRSWEYSVINAFNQNESNVLLEFTATANLENTKIQDKYADFVVFNYPLAKFRESGFTKDFQNLQADLPAWERSLIALVISEYRRVLGTDIRQNIKPVVLMKSSRVADSEAFYRQFFNKLSVLTPDEIVQLDNGEGLYHEALEHFRASDETLGNLVLALQLGFSKDKALIVNSRNEAERTQTQLSLNSLEDAENPYRIIFAVDMLNEGWDVLNLYDIVRLYETRKSKSYTTKEAQLIGRAARYYPFTANESQNRFTRKYDNDLSNPYRLLETMLFHSIQDSKYITELREALKSTGLIEPEEYTVTYKVKNDFKQTPFWHNGLIFANRKVEKPRGIPNSLPQHFRTKRVTVKARNLEYNVFNLFDGMRSETSGETQVSSKRFRELPYNLLLGTVEEAAAFQFNVLKRKFPGLTSIEEFLTSDEFLGNVVVDVICPEAVTPSARDWQNGVRIVVSQMESYLTRADKQYVGTTDFEGRKLHTVLRDKTVKLTRRDLDGVGTSQSHVSDNDIRLDLSDKQWYVFNDNYGTTEEKRLVRYMAGIIEALEQKYSEIYLVRNESFPELAIYDFESGERFEPDFLLFLRSKNSAYFEQEQIFIEPKGAHLLAKDRWKEDFLLQLAEHAVATTTYVDNTEYRIWGLPLYTHSESEQLQYFESHLQPFVENEREKTPASDGFERDES